MLIEKLTTLGPEEVVARAKAFFTERTPNYGAYVEHEGPGYLTLRGQGGEEIALAAFSSGSGSRVRGSSPLYSQAIGRFLTTLPEVAGE